MPTPLPDKRRIEQAETGLSATRSLTRSTESKGPRNKDPRYVRLAKTCRDSYDQYPARPANVFYVQFLDCTAPGVTGWQTIDAKTRSAVREKHLACTIRGQYVPEGTIVEVLWDRGYQWEEGDIQWWIDFEEAGDKIEFVELTTKLPLGGTAKAKLLEWDTGTKEFEMVGSEFWVQDYTKDSSHEPGKLIGAPTYRGWARRPRGVEGKLEAVDPENPTDPDSQVKWPLIVMEQVAEMIRVTLNSSFDGGYGYFPAATVTAWWNGKNPGATQNIYDPQGFFKQAKPGAKALARRNDREGVGDPEGASVPFGSYELVESQSLAGHISFTLNEDRTAGAPEESLEATLTFWLGTQQDMQEPAGTLQVRFAEGVYHQAKTGAKGTAVLDSETGIYWVDYCDTIAGILFFQLTEDRTGGAPEEPLQATPGHWMGTQNDEQQPPDETYDIWFQEEWYPYAMNGAHGVAMLDSVQEKYWAIQCDQWSPLHKCVLAEDMCPDSPADIETAVPMCYFPFSLAAEITSAANPYKRAALAGDIVLVARNHSEGTWEVVFVEGHKHDLVFDLRYYNCAIEKYVRECVVETCDAGHWETAITLQPKAIPIDTRVACPTAPEGESAPDSVYLQHDMRTVCLFDTLGTAPEDANWTDKVLFEPKRVVSDATIAAMQIEFPTIYVYTPCNFTAPTIVIEGDDQCVEGGGGA